MAEADEAGQTQQEIEADDEDAENDQPSRELDAVGADEGGKHEKQRAQKGEHDQRAR
ncbi:MAG: hypothetical protein V9G24_14670 [Rhodoblastus sp.]